LDRQIFSRSDIYNDGEVVCINKCIVDPKRITDDKLRNMGLDQYLPANIEKVLAQEEGRKPRKRIPSEEQVVMRAQAIPEIKRFFSQGWEPLLRLEEKKLPPCQQGYFRLFRGIEGDKRGYVLGVQNIGRNDKTFFCTTIDAARRRVDYIQDDNYKEEQKKLQTIGAKIDQLIIELDTGNWETIKQDGSLQRIQSDITQMIESLKNVENEYKVSILTELQRVVSFRDKNKRVNPSAAMTRMVKTRKFRDKRLVSLERIQSYLQPDGVRLDSFLAYEHAGIDTFCAKVESFAHEKTRQRRSLDDFLNDLRNLRRSAKTFQFAPYLIPFESMIREIDLLGTTLKSGKEKDIEMRKQAEFAYIRIYAISKVMRLDQDLIGLRSKEFKDGKPNIDFLTESTLTIQLEGILNKLNHRVADRVVVNDYLHLYEEFKSMVERWINLSRFARDEGQNLGERAGALKIINRQLHDYDLSMLEYYGELF